MCEAKPGPRCTPHAAETYAGALSQHADQPVASEPSPLDRVASNPATVARQIEQGLGTVPVDSIHTDRITTSVSVKVDHDTFLNIDSHAGDQQTYVVLRHYARDNGLSREEELGGFDTPQEAASFAAQEYQRIQSAQAAEVARQEQDARAEEAARHAYEQAERDGLIPSNVHGYGDHVDPLAITVDDDDDALSQAYGTVTTKEHARGGYVTSEAAYYTVALNPDGEVLSKREWELLTDDGRANLTYRVMQRMTATIHDDPVDVEGSAVDSETEYGPAPGEYGTVAEADAAARTLAATT